MRTLGRERSRRDLSQALRAGEALVVALRPGVALVLALVVGVGVIMIEPRARQWGQKRRRGAMGADQISRLGVVLVGMVLSLKLASMLLSLALSSLTEGCAEERGPARSVSSAATAPSPPPRGGKTCHQSIN